MLFDLFAHRLRFNYINVDQRYPERDEVVEHYGSDREGGFFRPPVRSRRQHGPDRPGQVRAQEHGQQHTARLVHQHREVHLIREASVSHRHHLYKGGGEEEAVDEPASKSFYFFSFLFFYFFSSLLLYSVCLQRLN